MKPYTVQNENYFACVKKLKTIRLAWILCKALQCQKKQITAKELLLDSKTKIG